MGFVKLNFALNQGADNKEFRVAFKTIKISGGEAGA